MYKAFADFYPKNLKEKYLKLLNYSDIKTNPQQFIGFVLVSGFGIALSFSMIIASFYKFPVVILFAAIFILFELSIYTYLSFKSDAKARVVEEVLPDALQLMSSNLRAGFTTDRALLLSARKEFGIFKDELNRVGKEITTGKDVIEALMTMKEHINSIKLHRTLSLVESGLRSGGELASLLDQTANNLRQEKFVEEKIKSNVMMYVIFIGGAVVFGAPLLFGLSSFLVEVFSSNLSSFELMESSASQSIPIQIGSASISIAFVIKYSIVSLITSSIMGSMLIGLIMKGKAPRGIKYIPIMTIISLSVFFVTRLFIGSFMSGIFSF